MLYTANKIAKELNLPSSTTRYWLSEQYRDFVSKEGKKYPEEVKKIVAIIKECRDEKKFDPEQTKEYLRQLGYEDMPEGEESKEIAIRPQQEFQNELISTFQNIATEQQKTNQMLANVIMLLMEGQGVKKTEVKSKASNPKTVKRRKTTKRKTTTKAKKPIGKAKKSRLFSWFKK